MRNIFIFGILLIAASTAGWFTVNREGDRTTIEINRQEIRADARKAIDRGRELLDRREQKLADERDANGEEYYYPAEQVATGNQLYPVQPSTYDGTYQQPQYDNQNYYPVNPQPAPGPTYPSTNTYYPQR